MTKRLVAKPTHRPLRSTSKTVPRLDVPKIAEALGAEPSDVGFDFFGGPLCLKQVQDELRQRLKSTGGRPALSDASRRTKIPLNENQWGQLEEIATEVASPGFSPSAGQIASVLISLSLRSLDRTGSLAIEEATSETATTVVD